MHTKTIIITTLLLINLCFGKSVTPIHIDSLFAHSTFVGVIEIESGFMGTDGANYTGKVFEIIKGDSSILNIRFGKYSGLAIGKRYLVFLAGSHKDSLEIIESFEYETTRLNQNRDYIIRNPKPDEVFKIPTASIILPKILVTFVVDRSNAEWSKDKINQTKWIKTEDFLLYLRKL